MLQATSADIIKAYKNINLVQTEGLIVLILHIDFKEIKLVICTPVNGNWPIIAYFYINTIQPTDTTASPEKGLWSGVWWKYLEECYT